MIEILNVRISSDIPQVADKWVSEVRMIDRSKGTHSTDWGEMLNWDKGLACSDNDLDVLLERTGEAITEALCATEEVPHPYKCSKCSYVAKDRADSKRHWMTEH